MHLDTVGLSVLMLKAVAVFAILTDASSVTGSHGQCRFSEVNLSDSTVLLTLQYSS